MKSTELQKKREALKSEQAGLTEKVKASRQALATAEIEENDTQKPREELRRLEDRQSEIQTALELIEPKIKEAQRTEKSEQLEADHRNRLAFLEKIEPKLKRLEEIRAETKKIDAEIQGLFTKKELHAGMPSLFHEIFPRRRFEGDFRRFLGEAAGGKPAPRPLDTVLKSARTASDQIRQGGLSRIGLEDRPATNAPAPEPKAPGLIRGFIQRLG